MQIAMPLFALATPEEPGAGGIPVSDDGLSTPTASFLAIMAGSAPPMEHQGTTSLPMAMLPVATKQATASLLINQAAATEIPQGESVLPVPHEAQEQIIAETGVPGQQNAILMQPAPLAKGNDTTVDTQEPMKTPGASEDVPLTPLPLWAGARGTLTSPASDGATAAVVTTQSRPVSHPGAEDSRIRNTTEILGTQRDSNASQPTPSDGPDQARTAVPIAAPSVATTQPRQGRASDPGYAVPTSSAQTTHEAPMSTGAPAFNGPPAGQKLPAEQAKHPTSELPRPILPPAASASSQPSMQPAIPESIAPKEIVGQEQHLPHQRNSAPMAQPTQIPTPSVAGPTSGQTMPLPADFGEDGSTQLSRQPDVAPSHTAADVPAQTMNRQAPSHPAPPLTPTNTLIGDSFAFTPDPKAMERAEGAPLPQTDPPELSVPTPSVSPAVTQAQTSQILPALMPQTWKDTAEVSRDAEDPDLAPLELKGSDLPQARMDPVAARTDVPRHMAQQIAEVARMMPDRPVELTLSPEELGRLRMTFTVEGNTLSVALSAERPETMDLMRRHIDALAQELREIGYDDVSFDFAQGGGSDSQKGDEAGSEAGFTTSDWSDTATDTLPPVPARLDLTGSGGMDIRL